MKDTPDGHTRQARQPRSRSPHGGGGDGPPPLPGCLPGAEHRWEECEPDDDDAMIMICRRCELLRKKLAPWGPHDCPRCGSRYDPTTCAFTPFCSERCADAAEMDWLDDAVEAEMLWLAGCWDQ
jgi:hypothetical protein